MGTKAAVGPDYLSFKDVKEIKQILLNDEEIMFTTGIWKKSRIWKRRNMMLTSNRLFVLDKSSVELVFDYIQIVAITKATEPKSHSFLVHVEG